MTEVAKGIYWVGAIDWNRRTFHGHHYTTPRGTTYNAYLIVDEKIALVDTVANEFYEEMLSRIRQIVPLNCIDYLIVQHVEVDHAGCVPKIMEECKNAKIYCTANGKEYIKKHFFREYDFNVVKTGDKLKLGKKTLTFIEAPLLHWPDSMFSYIEEEQLLMPNDAFGQHLATSERFADEVNEEIVIEEARKYYANILNPYSLLVLKKIDEIVKLGVKIKTIAPSHGVIWRNPEKIINAYIKWAKNESQNKVLIVYDTMWNSTEKMAKAILEGLVSEGISAKIYWLPVSDRNDILSEFIECKGILVGSSTINSGMLPSIPPLLEEIRTLRFKNKIGGAFGSHGWGGGAIKEIEEGMKRAGIEFIDKIAIKQVPNEEELKKCFEFGVRFGKRVKS